MSVPTEPPGDVTAIRPFQVSVPDEDLTELRRRIGATRWPERETVDDDSQGVPLPTMQELARHWATDYDWRTSPCAPSPRSTEVRRVRGAWLRQRNAVVRTRF